MGKLKYSWLFIFCFCFTYVFANDTTINFSLQKSIKGNFINFTVDNLGNIFLVTDNNQLKKYDANLSVVSVFNDVKQYGNISFIDASNPLKILIFYKDFSTILVLDRFLSRRNTIDLRSLNIVEVKTIAQSYDNNIWLFDELDASIKKIDDYGKLVMKTTDFRLLFDDAYNPSTMIDSNGMLYLYNEEKGWLIFDYYGALKSKFNTENWKDVQVNNKTLVGRNVNHFYLLQPPLPNINVYTTNIDLINATKVLQGNDLLYVLTKEGLSIYQLQGK